MKRKSFVYDFIFCGYYGFENVGDDAVLSVLVREIKEQFPYKSIAVISAGEYSPLKKYGVTFINRGSIIETLRAIRSSHTLVFGGGSLLQDVTSRRSLIYYSAILEVGRMFCRELSVLSNGIGPLDRFGEKIVSRILRKADRISVRDPESYKEALRLGASEESTSLCADPVFLMDFEEKQMKGLPEKYFSIALRKTANGRDVPENEIIKFCRKYSRRGFIPIFIPMQCSTDYEVCRRVAEKCGGRVICTANAEQVYAVLRGASFSVGMRLHFLFLSLMAGIPAVGLSYDLKIDFAYPYAGGEYIIPSHCVTAENLARAVENAQKNTDSEKLRSRCLEMRTLASYDVRSMSAAADNRQTLENTLYSKSV